METINIRGKAFSHVSKYRAGHVCTEAEARALNLSLKKHVSDTIRKRKDLHGETDERVQLAIDTFVTEFDFGEQRGYRVECLSIARQLVKKAIKAYGLNVSDYDASTITAEARDLLEDPKAAEGIRKQAERNRSHAPGR